jgi:hypothetical protein
MDGAKRRRKRQYQESLLKDIHEDGFSEEEEQKSDFKI